MLFCYSYPNFPSLLSPSQPTPHSHSQSLPGCPCLWVIYTCSLIRPFPFFPPLPPSCLPSGPCQSVPCFHSMFYFAHLFVWLIRFHLLGEIIWYLSFIAWLTALSIMLSSSIHPLLLQRVGAPSFFLLCNIPLCKCTIVF